MTTRTRSRDTVTTLPAIIYTEILRDTAVPNRLFKPNGQWYDTAGVDVLTNVRSDAYSPGVTGVVESITDVIGNQGNFNPVTHNKVTYDAPLSTVRMTGPLRQNNLIVEGRAESKWLVGCNKAKLDLVAAQAPFLATNDQLLGEAASRCNPSVVTPRFDASQQVAELIEGFKSLDKGLRTAIRIRRDITRLNRWNSPKVRRLLGKRTFAQLSMLDWASLATNAHLSYTLAIAPLIGACKQLRDATNKYDSIVNMYLGSKQTFHGVSTRAATYSYTYIPTYQDSPYAQCIYRAVARQKKEVRATVVVQFGDNSWLRPIGYEQFRKKAESGFDDAYYGRIPSISTAWQIMPLSFVVDWFWDVGSYLAQLSEVEIPQLEYNIIETGWSVKDTNVVEMTTQVGAGLYTSDFGSVQAAGLAPGTRTSEYYKRELKSFDPTVFVPSPPKLGLPDVGKAVTLAELVFSIVRGRRNLFQVTRPGLR